MHKDRDMAQPTRTINRLHFSDLDPLRFEDLCLNLVSGLHTWKELNHFGRKGSDGGVDILAIKKENDNEKIWFIQCKRYNAVSKADIKEIVDKVVGNPALPDKLLVIVSCDVNRTAHEFFKEYSKDKGIAETELWTASILESKLYKDHKDLLFMYFGLRLESKTRDNVAKIKHTLRMEKRVLKELIDHKFIAKTNDFKVFVYSPWAKFITHKVYIRSVEDTSYPNLDKNSKGKTSPWFRTFFYDTYHDGIEFWIDAGMGTEVIMDKDGSWEPLRKYNDGRKTNPDYEIISAKAIGRIPYRSIVDFKTNGDEFTSEPHFFCRFDFDGAPFEEIYYKSSGDLKKAIADWEFDRKKRTIFPED